MGFKLIQPLSTTYLAVPVDAQDEQIHSPFVLLNYFFDSSDLRASVTPPSNGSWQTRTLFGRESMVLMSLENSGFKMSWS